MSTDPNTVPFRVALTGGIASGKSAVANLFADLGIPVIDTDQLSREVQAPGTPVLAQIAATFGADVLDSSGALDRRRLREQVFADPVERQKLEAITHPAIRAELAKRSAQAKGPYQIHVIPLFAETGGKGDYDRVLVVDCAEEAQLQRLMQRDAVDATQAHRALAAQTTRQQRLKLATDVVTNTGTLADLAEQVQALHRRFLQAAQR